MAKFNTKRQKVHKSDRILDHILGSGVSLPALINILVELQEKHGSNAMFSIDVDSGECCASVSVIVSSTHLETDEEYNKRFEQHKVIEKHVNQLAYARKKQREEQDCRDYARLKKKFDNK